MHILAAALLSVCLLVITFPFLPPQNEDTDAESGSGRVEVVLESEIGTPVSGAFLGQQGSGYASPACGPCTTKIHCMKEEWLR